MEYAFFATTRSGKEIALRLASHFSGKVLRISDIREAFAGSDVLVFITAAGTAIRHLLPLIESQAAEPAILVIDQEARFVVPLLSGQSGEANERAVEVAEFLGAQAVITTFTDLSAVLSFEDVALRNDLVIENHQALQKLTDLLLQGAGVELHTDHDIEWDTIDATSGSLRVLRYDAEDPRMIRRGYQMCAREDIPAVFLTSRELLEAEQVYSKNILVLRPRDIVIGVSCRSRSNHEYVLHAVQDTLTRQGIPEEAICRIATSTLKAEEPAIQSLAEHMSVPLVSKNGDEIRKVSYLFLQTPFSQKTQSSETVAASAAYLASERGRMLLVRSSAPGGVMLALAQERKRIQI